MDSAALERLVSLKQVFDTSESYPDVTPNLLSGRCETSIVVWVHIVCGDRRWGQFLDALRLVTRRTEDSLGDMETFLNLRGLSGEALAPHLVAWVMSGSPYLQGNKDGNEASAMAFAY